MDISGLPLCGFLLPINNGSGIFYLKGLAVEEFIKRSLTPPPALGRFLETVELARLNEIIRELKVHRDRMRSIQYFREKLLSLIGKVLHLILDRRDK